MTSTGNRATASRQAGDRQSRAIDIAGIGQELRADVIVIAALSSTIEPRFTGPVTTGASFTALTVTLKLVRPMPLHCQWRPV